MNLQEFKKSGYKLKLVTAVDFIISDVIVDDNDSELTEDNVNDLKTEFEEAVVGSGDESFYQILDENDDMMFDELSEEEVVKIINELEYDSKKIVYILSNHGKTKNYVDAFTESMATFTLNKDKALPVDTQMAETLKMLLEKQLGEAYIIDHDA